jgi:hypothetical protein
MTLSLQRAFLGKCNPVGDGEQINIKGERRTVRPNFHRIGPISLCRELGPRSLGVRKPGVSDCDYGACDP